MDEQDQALKELRALLEVGGVLKIVTNEVHPELRTHHDDPRAPLSRKALAANPDAALRPATFVQHDVVSIEPATDVGEGLWRARSAPEHNDHVIGTPTALLSRLQKWRRG